MLPTQPGVAPETASRPSSATERAPASLSGLPRLPTLRVVLGLAGGLAIGATTLAVKPPLYQAEATVAVELRGDAAEAALLPPGLAGAQAAFVRSDQVLTRALAERGLAGAVPPTIEGLRSGLKVAQAEEGRLVRIGFEAASPEAAASGANAAAAAFAAVYAEMPVAAADRAMQGRVDDARRALDSAEAALTAQKAREDAAARARRLDQEQRLAGLVRALDEARTRAGEAGQKHELLQQGLAGGPAGEAALAALALPAIERLRAQQAEGARLEANLRATYGPLHPALKEAEQQRRSAERLLAAEVGRLAAAARREWDTRQGEEAALERRVEAARRGGDGADTNSVLAALERAAEDRRAALARATAEGRGRRAADSGLAASLLAPAPIPVAPASPNAALVLAGAAGAGLLAGALASWLGTRRRPVGTEAGTPAITESPVLPETLPEARPAHVADRDASPPTGREERPAEEPAAYLDVTCSLPLIARRPPRSGISAEQHATVDEATFWEMSERPSSPYSAAVELLARRVAEQSGPAGTCTVLVSSFGQGEGKSTLAANLAQAVSAQGVRVLLVDSETDHPASADTLDGVNPEEALDSPFRLVCHDADHTLAVLPLRQFLPDALPSSDRATLAGLVLRLSQPQFDVVVVDGPSFVDRPLAFSLIVEADLVLTVFRAKLPTRPGPRGPDPAFGGYVLTKAATFGPERTVEHGPVREAAA